MQHGSELPAGGSVFSSVAQGPLNMQCPEGLGPGDAPLYLELGHIWGGTGPMVRAVLQAPGLFILAGASFVEIPREHQALGVGVALVSVKLGQAAGEVFEGAAMVVADDGEVDLGLQAGCGADGDAGALPLNSQVVVLQEHGVPLLVLVLISRVALWGPGPWRFDLLLGALPQPCSLWPDKIRGVAGCGMGERERKREIKMVNDRRNLGAS